MNEDKDLRNGFTLVGVIAVSVIFALWSYNMFGPQDIAQVAIKAGYVQKVIPTAETDTTTIWVKGDSK